ncbi:MAG: MFS transporter, partial [Candidatus Hermodarchaeota archaeon]
LWSLDTFVSMTLIDYYYNIVGYPNYYFLLIPLSITRFTLPFLMPLLGFLSDRNYFFTRGHGRRFLWILVSGLLLPLLFLLSYIEPIEPASIFEPIDPSFVMLYTIIYFLYNLFYVLYSTTLSALVLNKFRSPKERTLLAGVLGTLSTVSALIIPVFVPYIEFLSLDLTSFRVSLVAFALIFIVTLTIGIFGLLEEQGLKDTYLSRNQAPKEWFLKDFFKRFSIFGRKNFLVLLIRYIAFALLNLLFLNNIHYFWEYVLNEHYPSYVFYSLLYLIGIPHGFLLAWFKGHLKIVIVTGFIMGALLIGFFFVAEITMAIILISIIGFVFGFMLPSLLPLQGDVFDEYAHKKRKRSEGFGYGMLGTFGSFVALVATFSVYDLPGFEYGWGPQPPSVVMGIRIITTLIPGIILIIVMIIFTLVYDLKPEKTEAIRMELKELEI